jgi:multiple antibiotic resistance protein
MLAAVLLTENNRVGFLEQVQVTAVMLSVLVVALVLMLAGGPLHGLIGNSGASVISRVMGMIRASVATANILSGIEIYFAAG